METSRLCESIRSLRAKLFFEMPRLTADYYIVSSLRFQTAPSKTMCSITGYMMAAFQVGIQQRFRWLDRYSNEKFFLEGVSLDPLSCQCEVCE